MTQTLGGAAATLRSTMVGGLLTQEDSDYDQARSLWNGGIDRRPALIARCRTPQDVSAALRLAREQGLEVSVRGGGHNVSGAACVDDGMMIDLSPIDQVRVDPHRRRASCGGGATLAALDAATQEFGLAVPAGTISHTGVGGLTLGGGYGWLTRMAGLSIDNLVSAEVVLADGRIVRASADSEPDLFWAIRGGGGQFGVVTEFEFALHEVGPTVQLGFLFWELERAAEALRVARDLCDRLPDDAGAMIAGVNAPPADFVPVEHHFRPGIALIVAGFASPEAHHQLIAPALEAAPPLFELVTPIPYTALQQMIDGAAPWGMHAYTKGLYLDELSDDAIDVIAGRLPAKTSPLSIVPIFPLGGAYARVGEDDTALAASRSARYMVGMDALAPTAELWAADREWVRSLWTALRPFARDDGGYINFMSEFEEDRVRAAFGHKFDRLRRIKAQYDPTNTFRRGAAIPPT
jgi:hypothetical protein